MKSLTIIIPLYNEGERIVRTLNILKKGVHLPGLLLDQIIFIDDGSTDRTVKKLIAAKNALKSALKTRVTIISYSPNRGRGYAIRFGGLISKSDYVLYIDGDLSIPLSNLKAFEKFISYKYDLIFGSKKKSGAKAVIPRSFLRKTVGYGHSFFASLVLGVFAWDYQGGFKLFSRRLIREIFPDLTIDRWGFDMEVIFLAKKLGYQSEEIPVVWSHFENGSKVKLLRDILRSVKEIFTIKYYWLMGRYTQSVPSISPTKVSAYSVY